MQPAPLTKRFLSVPEAARYCGVSRNTLYTWVRHNKLRSYKTPGNTNRIRASDLVAFMATSGLFVPQALHQLAEQDVATEMGAVTAPRPLVMVVDPNDARRGGWVVALHDIATLLQPTTVYEALHLALTRTQVALAVLAPNAMPEGGLDVAAELRRIRPTLPLVDLARSEAPVDPANVREVVLRALASGGASHL
jgi:excisionase family DNA binding protein